MTDKTKGLTPELEQRLRQYHARDPHEADSCVLEYPCPIPALLEALDAERAKVAALEQEQALIDADTQRGITDCSTPLFQRVRNMREGIERLEAAHAETKRRLAEAARAWGAATERADAALRERDAAIRERDEARRERDDLSRKLAAVWTETVAALELEERLAQALATIETYRRALVGLREPCPVCDFGLTPQARCVCRERAKAADAALAASDPSAPLCEEAARVVGYLQTVTQSSAYETPKEVLASLPVLRALAREDRRDG